MSAYKCWVGKVDKLIFHSSHSSIFLFINAVVMDLITSITVHNKHVIFLVKEQFLSKLYNVMNCL